MKNRLRYCALSLSLLCINHALGMQPGQQLYMRDNITHIKNVGEKIFKKIKETPARAVDGSGAALTTVVSMNCLLSMNSSNSLDIIAKQLIFSVPFGITSFMNLHLHNGKDHFKKKFEQLNQSDLKDLEEFKKRVDGNTKILQNSSNLLFKQMCCTGLVGLIVYGSDDAVTNPFVTVPFLYHAFSSYRFRREANKMKTISKDLENKIRQMKAQPKKEN